jgi:hypothetical protein
LFGGKKHSSIIVRDAFYEIFCQASLCYIIGDGILNMDGILCRENTL